MGPEQMRAGDADRQQVAERLRVALEEGRLDLHEYDERVRQAYAAKTYGDLESLLADLPAGGVVPAPREPAGAEMPGNATRVWLVSVWGSWAGTVAITTAIWLVVSLVSGFHYFWPVWVAVPWGLMLLVMTVGGLAGGAPRKAAEEKHRKALAKDRRRERRQLQAEAIARGELPAKPTKQQRRKFIARAVDRGELPPKQEKA